MLPLGVLSALSPAPRLPDPTYDTRGGRGDDLGALALVPAPALT